MQKLKTFTAEVMADFRRAIQDGRHRRYDALTERLQETRALLADAWRRRASIEGERRTRAAHESRARQAFLSALREQVGKMKGGLRARREEIAAELRAMARELGAARSAFRGDPDR